MGVEELRRSTDQCALKCMVANQHTNVCFNKFQHVLTSIKQLLNKSLLCIDLSLQFADVSIHFVIDLFYCFDHRGHQAPVIETIGIIRTIITNGLRDHLIHFLCEQTDLTNTRLIIISSVGISAKLANFLQGMIQTNDILFVSLIGQGGNITTGINGTNNMKGIARISDTNTDITRVRNDR